MTSMRLNAGTATALALTTKQACTISGRPSLSDLWAPLLQFELDIPDDMVSIG
jgi:hypothetical protein